MMKIPILTYHSADIRGNDYRDNDLTALAEDLEQITLNGIRIVPLAKIVDLWLTASDDLSLQPTVAITCDDGTDFDYHDLPHPVAGPQRSILNILRDFRSGKHRLSQPELSITSFVIVSPTARARLDETCLIGKRWWNDDWWKPALDSGLIEIGSHSWDHNHDTLPAGDFPAVVRGTFDSIVSDDLADFQIATATRHLMKFAKNPATSLFAYPYGKSNAFLVEDYLPRRAAAIGLKAALADKAEPLHRDSQRWDLPRYVFRRDWNSPEELGRILALTRH